MVNGPRPGTLSVATPAQQTAMYRPAGAQVATPTVLSRQHTSVYSTGSGATPVLVFGKAVTPLQGNWADEPWSPKDMPPRAPIGLVEVLDNPGMEQVNSDMQMDDDTNSTSADTAAFEERNALLRHARSVLTAAASSASTAAPNVPVTPMTSLDTTPAEPTTTPNTHISFSFRYDPYSQTVPRTEVYRCTCEECLDRQPASGIDLIGLSAHPSPASYQYPSATYGSYESPATPDALDTQGMGQPYNSQEGFDTAYSCDDMATYAMLPTTETAEYWAPAEEAPTTSFMPPPPPPRIARRVIAESAEPTLDADSAFYLIVMRWYKKLSATQHYWVTAENVCPPPNFDMTTFDEWVDEVGRWWLRHFEHVQVKTTASSGLIRSGAPAPQPAAPQRPATFETHTTVQHSAVRQPQPRRQFGKSGLTAEMLASHNEFVPPRPQRQRRELPW